MEPRLTQCSQELDSNENQCALESKSQTTQINVEDGRNPCYKRRGRFCNSNAARERSRVKTLRTAFLELQQTLPAVPPDTKLSKLDVLVLATTYICHLMRTLDGGRDKASFSAQGFMHPVKKWPMRTRLYAGILASTQRDGEAGYRGQLTSTDTTADWRH